MEQDIQDAVSENAFTLMREIELCCQWRRAANEGRYPTEAEMETFNRTTELYSMGCLLASVLMSNSPLEFTPHDFDEIRSAVLEAGVGAVKRIEARRN